MDYTEKYRAMYERFLQSQLTMGEFCKKENISTRTLLRWKARLKEMNKFTNEVSAKIEPISFFPITIENEPSHPFEIHGELVYPNGVVLRLNRTASLQEIESLIKIY